MTPHDVIVEARKWVGTPFRHQGHTLGSGVDCIGLVYGVALKLELTDAKFRPYGREPFNGLLESVLNENLVKVHKKEMTEGDILLFRFARYPQHVGFYTGRSVIHSYQNIGKCIEHILDDKWKRRIVDVYRFREFVA